MIYRKKQAKKQLPPKKVLREKNGSHNKRISLPIEAFHTENPGIVSTIRSRSNSLEAIYSTATDIPNPKKKHSRKLSKLKKQLPVDQTVKELSIKLAERTKLIMTIFENISPPLTFCARVFHKLGEKSTQELLVKAAIDEKVSIQRLSILLKERNTHIPDSDIHEYLQYFPPIIPLDVMEQLFKSYIAREKNCQDTKVKALMRHIAMRMQMNRIPKQKLPETLFGANYTENKRVQREQLKSLLGKYPFNFHVFEELEILTDFLLQNHDMAGSIVRKVSVLTEEWKVFNDDEEEKLETNLKKIVKKNVNDIKKAMTLMDPENTGFILIEQLFQIFKDLDIKLNPCIVSYIKLIFYSYTYELDKAPYPQFLKVFGKDEEKHDTEVEYVRKLLGIIAKNLIKYSKSIRTTFVGNRGMIPPKGFKKGLEQIGMGNIDAESFNLLVAALQDEGDTGETWIDLEELEEIFEFYGVPKEPAVK